MAIIVGDVTKQITNEVNLFRIDNAAESYSKWI